MPIYAYRCSECGHQGDHLQKMSDPQLTVCPKCQAPKYEKQLSAVGIALKGTASAPTASAVPHQCGPGCQH
ncbi:zinc ribbon domain-containing protein [Chitinibacter sp. SCUT-21]|uniref:FmdB family zinc ribbon protein n=1 Tax=Chitinibacter sp. SCUT-21 TaxID=2970891 RepID=UPI0035A5C6D8